MFAIKQCSSRPEEITLYTRVSLAALILLNCPFVYSRSDITVSLIIAKKQGSVELHVTGRALAYISQLCQDVVKYKLVNLRSEMYRQIGPYNEGLLQ